MVDTLGIKIGRKIIEKAFTQKIAYSGTNAEYIGEAVPGTASSVAKWRIKKLTYNASKLVTDVKWASGTEDFDKEFDERENYSYS